MISSASITQPPRINPTTSIVEILQRGHGSDYRFYQIPTQIPISAKPFEALLSDLSRLEQDWDGYGALPLSGESCAHALGFLSTIPQGMPMPEITPTANGTISFEWQSSRGDAYLEIGRTRYSGHIHPRDGRTVYVQGQLTDPVQQKLATEQVLLIIKELLYAASASDFFTHTIQIAEPAF